jgi:hypothetical protein
MRHSARIAFFIGLVVSLLFSALPLRAAEPEAKIFRAGMIGLDTSHVPAFAKVFNNPKATGDVAAVKVVGGYPGGTDIPASRDRVGKFTDQLREMKIEVVDTIPELLKRVDVVLLESVDGRIHLQEAIPVIKASCSYSPGTPDMFFYGIHGIEPLFVLMGRGCETVSRVHTADTDFVTGVWKDGRIGTYRGIRKAAASSGALVYGAKSIAEPPKGSGGGYEALCHEIARFFKTGKSPVAAEETIEIFTFMEAADESKRRGGAPVPMSEVLAKAKAEAAAKLSSISQ